MQILQQDHVSVNTQSDGTFVWVLSRSPRLPRTSRESFASFDEAADAATRIAECYGLPLAADVSLFIEMASPWYSGRENVEVL